MKTVRFHWPAIMACAGLLLALFAQEIVAACSVACAGPCLDIDGYQNSSDVCLRYCEDEACMTPTKSCSICDNGSCCQPNPDLKCCNDYKAIYTVLHLTCDGLCGAGGFSRQAENFKLATTTKNNTNRYVCKPIAKSGGCPE